MKHLPLRSMIVAISCISAGACDQNGNLVLSGGSTPTSPTTSPTRVISVLLDPKAAQAAVGETQRFDARPSDTTGINVGWTTTGSALSIVQQGLSATVKCEKVGSGTVTVTAGSLQTNTATDEGVVTCSDPVAFTVLPAADHAVGKTPCPQPLGNIHLTNLSGQSLSVTARSGNKAIDVGPGDVSVGPKEGLDFKVTFNCDARPPVKTTIVFTVVVNGISLTYVSDVMVNGV